MLVYFQNVSNLRMKQFNFVNQQLLGLRKVTNCIKAPSFAGVKEPLLLFIL